MRGGFGNRVSIIFVLIFLCSVLPATVTGVDPTINCNNFIQNLIENGATCHPQTQARQFRDWQNGLLAQGAGTEFEVRDCVTGNAVGTATAGSGACVGVHPIAFIDNLNAVIEQTLASVSAGTPGSPRPTPTVRDPRRPREEEVTRSADQSIDPIDEALAQDGFQSREDGSYLYQDEEGNLAVAPNRDAALKVRNQLHAKQQEQDDNAQAISGSAGGQYFCIPAQQGRFWENTSLMLGSVASAIATVGLGVLAPMYQYKLAREDQQIARAHLATQEKLASQNAELGWPTYMGAGYGSGSAFGVGGAGLYGMGMGGGGFGPYGRGGAGSGGMGVVGTDEYGRPIYGPGGGGGAVVGYDAYGNPIFAGGGPGAGGYVDVDTAGVNQAIAGIAGGIGALSQGVSGLMNGGVRVSAGMGPGGGAYPGGGYPGGGGGVYPGAGIQGRGGAGAGGGYPGANVYPVAYPGIPGGRVAGGLGVGPGGGAGGGYPGGGGGGYPGAGIQGRGGVGAGGGYPGGGGVVPLRPTGRVYADGGAGGGYPGGGGGGYPGAGIQGRGGAGAGGGYPGGYPGGGAVSYPDYIPAVYMPNAGATLGVDGRMGVPRGSGPGGSNVAAVDIYGNPVYTDAGGRGGMLPPGYVVVGQDNYGRPIVANRSGGGGISGNGQIYTGNGGGPIYDAGWHGQPGTGATAGGQWVYVPSGAAAPGGVNGALHTGAGATVVPAGLPGAYNTGATYFQPGGSAGVNGNGMVAVPGLPTGASVNPNIVVLGTGDGGLSAGGGLSASGTVQAMQQAEVERRYKEKISQIQSTILALQAQLYQYELAMQGSTTAQSAGGLNPSGGGGATLSGSAGLDIRGGVTSTASGATAGSAGIPGASGAAAGARGFKPE